VKLDIIITKDEVTIEGVVVKRPAWMAPSEWRDFWRNAVDPPKAREPFYGFGADD
jgi:hypothetical protein